MNYFQKYKLSTLLIYGANVINFANSIFTKHVFLNICMMIIISALLSINLISQSTIIDSGTTIAINDLDNPQADMFVAADLDMLGTAEIDEPDFKIDKKVQSKNITIKTD